MKTANLRALRRAPKTDSLDLTLRMALINVRSLANKIFVLNDFFTSYKLDFTLLTETWLHVGESASFSELLPPNCTCFSSPRTTGKGGGLATVFKSTFQCRLSASVNYSSFELQLFELNASSSSTLCAVVYRPPKFNKDFMQDFADFIAGLRLNYDHFIICGDLPYMYAVKTNLWLKIS